MKFDKLPIEEVDEAEARRGIPVHPPGGVASYPVAYYDAKSNTLTWFTRRDSEKRYWQLRLDAVQTEIIEN